MYHWAALIGAFVGLLSLLLAAYVLHAARQSPLARLVAAILACEGILQAAAPLPTEPGQPLASLQLLQQVLFGAALLPQPWLYLLLVSRLETPLAGPLRRRHVQRLLRLLAVALPPMAVIAVLLAPPASGGAWAMPTFAATLLLLAAANIWGLLGAFSAWRRAEVGSLRRERAGAFALAFGTRDALLLIAVGFALAALRLDAAWVRPLESLLFATASLALVTLLAYGILRTRLLDIDARIQSTVGRGAIVLAVIVAFTFASQAAEALAGPGYALGAGSVAAIVVALALGLFRHALGKARHDAPPLAAFTQARRLEIYRLALEENEGRDSALLAAMRRGLGVSDRDHELLRQFAAPQRSGGGALLGRFHVRQVIGEGSQGRAVLAHDARLQRDVVLKAMPGDGAHAEASLREARALAQVRHPNVVAVHDSFLVDGQAFMVLEDAGRENLRDHLARVGPLRGAALRHLGEGLLSGLAAIHRAGLLHRDLKPANILIAADGTPKLADLGLATLRQAEGTLLDRDASGGQGTLAYLSPEQARGEGATAASDVYAAGLALYEAAEGFPYLDLDGRATAGERLAIAAAPGPFRPASQAEPGINSWLARALDPDARRRHQEGAEALEHWREIR